MKMKTLVLGDIHGRDCWEDIIDKENPDKVIFLGDYVSTHEDIDSSTQLENLHEILRTKNEWRDDMILLRGNHDMQHLGYPWAECSGYDKYVGIEMAKIKEEFLKSTQWVYMDDNIVFSHAGVSAVWMKNVGLDDINKINELEPSEFFGFWPCKMSDFYGISPTQPCTWIRPQTLVEYMPEGIIQVVGHSPVKKICNVSIEVREKYNIKCPDLWCCDALPEQYLIIENDEFIVKEYDERRMD